MTLTNGQIDKNYKVFIVTLHIVVRVSNCTKYTTAYMCKPCVLWSLKLTVLESCISQTLLLAETILVDTPVVGQDYMHVWILLGGGGVGVQVWQCNIGSKPCTK